VVSRIGSTTLMRNGSMMVFMGRHDLSNFS